MIVRREQAADHDAVATITRLAFDRAVEAQLTAALRADAGFVPELSLVAERGGHVLGHVIGTRATIGDVAALGLGPIAVAPRQQGEGIGTALMHAVLGGADALGFPAVVLLGDPGFYARFGFVLAAEHGIVPPVDGWIPHFQVRTLAAWQPEIAGPFTYAAPFADV
jgi:putative acetyltransferase